MSATRTAVIITAAGSGSRLGASAPKALAQIHGEPLVLGAARRAIACQSVDELIITAPRDHVAHLTELFDRELNAVMRGALTVKLPVRVVPGGPSRQASVAAGLAAVSGDIAFVLVHDAARPLTPPAVFDRVINQLKSGAQAVIPVLPVTDTIKRVAGPLGEQVVIDTVNREHLRRVQTPQGFTRPLLMAAHAAQAAAAGQEDTSATDDASLVEAQGTTVICVAGDELALKITTPHDLLLAEILATDTGRTG